MKSLTKLIRTESWLRMELWDCRVYNKSYYKIKIAYHVKLEISHFTNAKFADSKNSCNIEGV